MHARLCGRSDPLGALGSLACYLADHAIILTNDTCQKIGRDPATIELPASVEAHLLSPGEQRKADTPEVTGTPEEIAEMLHEFAHVGVKHLIVVSPSGVAGLERFARVIELLDQGS